MMRHAMAYLFMLKSSMIACHWIVTLLQLGSHDMMLAELHWGALPLCVVPVVSQDSRPFQRSRETMAAPVVPAVAAVVVAAAATALVADASVLCLPMSVPDMQPGAAKSGVASQFLFRWFCCKRHIGRLHPNYTVAAWFAWWSHLGSVATKAGMQPLLACSKVEVVFIGVGFAVYDFRCSARITAADQNASSLLLLLACSWEVAHMCNHQAHFHKPLAPPFPQRS